MPSKGLPHQAQVEVALRALLRAGHPRPVTTQHAYDWLADHFKLTLEERTRRLQSEARSEWENIVRQAKRRMVDEKLLYSEPDGYWHLTETGLLTLDDLDL